LDSQFLILNSQRNADKLGEHMKRSQFFKTRRPVIRSYDYFHATSFLQTFSMQRDSSAAGLTRRDFIKLGGAGAAPLALINPAFAGWFAGLMKVEVKLQPKDTNS